MHKITDMEPENKPPAHLDFKKLTWVAAIFVAFVTLLIYLPALQNEFVNWDDHLYVSENPNIRSLDIRFLKWSLTEVVVSLWHPLTMFSLALDYAVWGLNPLGYHLTNILFHTANTFLAFILVVRLIECGLTQNSKLVTRNFYLIAASATALLFGIHPLRVESVVWVSERKDVLCAFFFLMSLLSYLKYTAAGNSKKSLFYAASLISFTLALMSKPMAVSLPFVLLILDFYPLKRLTTIRLRGILTEKLPFFILSVLSALATIWASSEGEALVPLGTLPLTDRVYMAVNTWVLYIVKMILPFNLAPLYPLPKAINPLVFEYIAAIFIFSAITAFSLRSLKRERLFFAVWLYYLVALIPVLGIVKVGSISMADRYTYLPSLGPFLLVGLGIAMFSEKCSKRQCQALIITTLLLISSLVIKTIKQIDVWKDSITLWSYEIKHFPDTAYIAYYDRGKAYYSSGSYQEAIRDFSRTIEINPRYLYAYYNRGNAYDEIGDHQLSIKDFDRAIEFKNPKKKSMAYTNRGIAYYAMGNIEQAINDCKKAVELDPENAEAHYNLGVGYSKAGNIEQALIYYKKAAGMGLKQAQDYLKKQGINPPPPSSSSGHP